jgi:type IV pilus assembly protein PilB
VKQDEIDFGADLVRRGIITAERLEEAMARSRDKKESLRTAITGLRILGVEEHDKARAAYAGIPYISLSNYYADLQVLMLIKEQFASSEVVFPLFRTDTAIAVAISDPTNLVTLDQIRSDTGLEVQPYYAAEQAIIEAIGRNYASAIMLAENEEATLGTEGAADVPKLIDSLLNQALHAGASDLHLEPGPKGLLVRQRVDGLLAEIHSFPDGLKAQLTSRIKVLASLDISETRTPQDGQIQTTIGGEEVSLRVSTVPTIHGENVVVRFLVGSKTHLGLNSLGLPPDVLERFSALIQRPHGMVIVTGPTGSGKTTTLYAALEQLNTISQNIMTIEDPVEYTSDLFRQIQVNERVGLSFASGLRSILRQDPDIIMVGEIRDAETATVAVHAALTGHLVLTTLHTNEAAGAITRLLHMGIPPFLISSSVVGVLAQRLVRCLCLSCRKPGILPEEFRELLPGSKNGCFFPEGCEVCKKSGYRGRTGLYQLLEVTPEIQDAIIEKAPAGTYERLAMARGMAPLVLDGLRKVAQGVTSLEEVMAAHFLSPPAAPAPAPTKAAVT